jgi:hypothetical protein
MRRLARQLIGASTAPHYNTRVEPLPSLSYVITLRDIGTPDGVLPDNSIGTIVSDYENDGVYLVEFSAPWHLQQISRADMRPISDDELAVRVIDWSDCPLVQLLAAVRIRT